MSTPPRNKALLRYQGIMNQHILLNIQADYFLGAMGTGIGEQVVKRMGDGFNIVRLGNSPVKL